MVYGLEPVIIPQGVWSSAFRIHETVSTNQFLFPCRPVHYTQCNFHHGLILRSYPHRRIFPPGSHIFSRNMPPPVR